MSSDTRVGRTHGAYRVERRLGEGGMGIVYEAIHTTTGDRVALKCLKAQFTGDKEVTRRFYRELHASTILDHPNICSVRDVGHLDDGSFFIALELLSGTDLSERIAAEGQLSVEETLRIALQICEGLSAAHTAGIVHRDLKPDNVFLTAEGAKLLDFGVSKLLSPEMSATHTGLTVGTPYYMAPEQAQALKTIDHRADLYSLGVVIFRCLTGQHPFDADSYPMLIVQICTAEAPALGSFREDVPARLALLVRELLSKSPDDRPQSASEVQTELAACLRNEPLPASARLDPLAATRPAHGQPEKRSGTTKAAATEEGTDDDEPATTLPGAGANVVPWLVGALALAVVVVAGFALTLFSEDDSLSPPEAPPLPEPQEPFEDPLVTAAGGTGLSWRWVNPLPRAMPTWYGVDVLGPQQFAVVGRWGTAIRFDGTSVLTWPARTGETLRGVAWTSPREAIAVGDGGTLRVLRLDSDPLVVETGTNEDLHGVVPQGPGEAVIVGAGGTWLRLRGYVPEATGISTDPDLLAVSQIGDLTVAVGEAGTLVTAISGGAPVVSELGSLTLRAVGGCRETGIYAAGDQGTVFHRFLEAPAEGPTWHRLPVPGRRRWLAVGCDRRGPNAVLAAEDGTLLIASGTEFLEVPSGTTAALRAVAGSADGSAWIVGEGGRLLQLERGRVRTLTAGETFPLRAGGTVGGALIAAGEWGRVLRQTENGFDAPDTPTDAAISAMVPFGEAALVAVGDSGTILRIGYEAIEELASPTERSLRDLVASPGHILAVGAEGTLVEGRPGALRVRRIAATEDLWGVAGVPDDAVAVGNDGTVLRLGEDGPSRVACDVGDLHGVYLGPEGVWAVGEDSTIVRIEAGQCFPELQVEGGPMLEAIDLGPEGRLLAVGELGSAYVRGDGGDWERIPFAVGPQHFRAIVGTPREVFILGTGGAVLRHPRLR